LTKKFKYSSEHAKLGCDCPDLDQLEPVNTIAYRFVFKDPTHPKCSSPNLVNNPGRKTKSCEERCGCWALSFWRSYSQAESLLKHYLKTNKNFASNAGDYIAECTITAEDGLAEKNSDSHINLHEFSETDFTNRFVNLKHIMP
jgi:hypothetical protein